MWPWIFGDKCPLPALVKMLDGVEHGEPLAPGTYHNMITVLVQFMPEILPTAALLGIELPTEPPSLDIFRGWDPED
jgi:hypothetical protein